MVWIYGGGFHAGYYSSSLYGPEYFMPHEVIIVTVNYRLGVFGFLSTGDSVLPGNQGMKDQVFALKWINENIAAFGGDPAKVTIFGESAGGVAVSLLTLSKQTKGLFRAAICQSGSALNTYSLQTNPKRVAYKTASVIDEAYNDTDISSEKLLEFLLTVDAKELNKAGATVFSEESLKYEPLLYGFVFGPVLEPHSVEAFLSEGRYELLQSGNFNQVPTIFGITSEEALGMGERPDFPRVLISWDNDVKSLVPHNMNIVDTENKINVGNAIKNFYSHGSLFIDNVVGGVLYYTDAAMVKAAVKTAKLQANYSNVYFYRFSYDGPLGQNNFSLQGAEKVQHFEDVYYMWHMDEIDRNTYPESDIQTSDRLLVLWTNFAKTLNPTPEKVDLLDNVTWPVISSEGPNNFVYLDIGENLTLQNHPRERNVMLWEHLYETYGVPPFSTY